MIGLLLPLLAAVSAETFYLECEFENLKIIQVLGINPSGEIGILSSRGTTN